MNAGTLNIGTNSISLKSNAYVESTLSNSGGDGLIFNGTSGQQLYGLSNSSVEIGTITINNTSGISIPDGNGYDFRITQELALDGGVFNIGGSLLTIATGANITTSSTYNSNNMVQTNSSFTDNGLKIEFAAVGAPKSIFFPVGELKYTPVSFNLTSSTTGGDIRVRPANEKHPTVIDATNALAYHWIVASTGLSGANGNAVYEYSADDLIVTGPNTSADYIPVRLTSADNGTWDKSLTTADFDEGAQNFTFPLSNLSSAEISGEYTAGVPDAIPDEIASYETNFVGSGNYTETINWSKVNAASPDITNGVGPVGAAITIKSGADLTLNASNIRLYSTVIESGGILRVPSTVHRCWPGNGFWIRNDCLSKRIITCGRVFWFLCL